MLWCILSFFLSSAKYIPPFLKNFLLSTPTGVVCETSWSVWTLWQIKTLYTYTYFFYLNTFKEVTASASEKNQDCFAKLSISVKKMSLWYEPDVFFVCTGKFKTWLHFWLYFWVHICVKSWRKWIWLVWAALHFLFMSWYESFRIWTWWPTRNA